MVYVYDRRLGDVGHVAIAHASNMAWPCRPYGAHEQVKFLKIIIRGNIRGPINIRYSAFPITMTIIIILYYQE